MTYPSVNLILGSALVVSASAVQTIVINAPGVDPATRPDCLTITPVMQKL